LAENKNNKLVILSLDVSSVSTGWAYFVYKCKKKSIILKNYGTLSPSAKDTSGRLILFESMLKILIHEISPDVIVIEDLNHMRNMNVVKTLAAFLGTARKLSYEFLHSDPIQLGRTAVLKSVLGDGSAKKQKVVEFVNSELIGEEKLPYNVKEAEDISDAIITGYSYLLSYQEERKDG